MTLANDIIRALRRARLPTTRLPAEHPSVGNRAAYGVDVEGDQAWVDGWAGLDMDPAEAALSAAGFAVTREHRTYKCDNRACEAPHPQAMASLKVRRVLDGLLPDVADTTHGGTTGQPDTPTGGGA